jgi:hypothetical protein
MIGRLLRWAVRTEIDTWISLARWVGHRPDVGAGGRAFPYRGPELPLILTFTVLSIGEVVLIDTAVPWSPAWTWLRMSLLVMGLWGVFLALGLLAAVTVHPHVAGPAELRIRSGRRVDVRLPRSAVTAVRATARIRDGRSVQVHDGVLALPVGNRTTVEITLDPPVEATLPGYGTVPLRAVHLHADDAAAFARAARPRPLPSDPGDQAVSPRTTTPAPPPAGR